MSHFTIPDSIVSRQLGEECVIVDLKSESIFELNRTGARAWQLLEAGLDSAELATRMSSEFVGPEATIRAEVDHLLSSLQRNGLIEPAPSPPARPAPEPERPAFWVLRWSPGHGQPPDLLRGSSGPAPTIHIAPDGAWAMCAGFLFGIHDDAKAEHALATYRARGGDFADSLRGAFLVSVWDPKRDALLLARDAMGLCPCFYHFDGHRLLFGTDITALVQQPGVSKAANSLLLGEYVHGFVGGHQRSETFYEGVLRLPPAHWATVDEAGLRVRRYWDPLPDGFEWASAAEVASLETVLGDAVQRCLSVGADSLALSGGYDSVSLALLGAQRRPDGPPLTALSLRMTGSPTDEGPVQKAVASALGMPQILEEIPPPSDRVAFVSRALARSSQLPGPVLSPWQWLYESLLLSARAADKSAVMVGTGGDEMFVVDPRYAYDLLARGQLEPLGHFVAAWMRTSPLSAARVLHELLWKSSVRPALARSLVKHLPRRHAWLGRRGRTWVKRMRGGIAIPGELDERLRQRAASASSRVSREDGEYVRSLRELVQSPLLMMEFDQSEAWCRHFGVRFLYPFLDREVVDLVLRAPPRSLYATGRMKAPLRELVRKTAPSLPLPERKVDFTAFGNELLQRSAPEALRRMGGVRQLEEAGIVVPGATEGWFKDYAADRVGTGIQAWRLLSAEAWLRGHRSSW